MSLAADYFLLVAVAAAGALQIVCAYSGLRGLLLIPNKTAAYGIGALFLVGSFTWFVLNGAAITPGDLGGVEGAQQFTYFFYAVATSSVLTAIIASLTQIRTGPPPQGVNGIEALRYTTLLGSWRARFSKRGPRG